MSKTSIADTWEIRYRILSYLAGRVGKSRKGKVVSYREIERALDYSPTRVRYACRQLVLDEFMSCKPHYAEDGGQRGNAYTITAKGWKFMKEREEANAGGCSA